MSQEKNYSDYGYAGNEKITMDAMSFIKLKAVVEAFLEKETNVTFPEKYKYINSQTGEDIKTVNEKNKAVARKIVDIDATLNSQPHISRTAVGLELLDVQILMNKTHMQMVDEGVAKHKSEFELKEERNVFEEAPLGESVEGTEE